jgi:hypothetical protein
MAANSTTIIGPMVNLTEARTHRPGTTLSIFVVGLMSGLMRPTLLLRGLVIALDICVLLLVALAIESIELDGRFG